MEFTRQKYLDKLIALKHNRLIKVITGARRSGKSYLLNTLFYRHLIASGVEESHIIRFSFDNDEHIDLLDSFIPEEKTKLFSGKTYTINSKKFRAYIRSLTSKEGQYYLLLDEIQILDSFVGTLNGFLSHDNFDVYVTGSNSEMLSSDIETKFRGRKSSLHVYPLAFSEVLEQSGKSPQETYSEYLFKGGVPLVYQLKEEEAYNYLEELCNEVYLKDIIARRRIGDIEVLSSLFSMLASTIGSPVSPSSLEKAFKEKRKLSITDDTIDHYIDYFEDAFVIKKVHQYNIKGKAIIDSPYKVYFEDIGVRNARSHFLDVDESLLLENIIFNELRYRGYDVTVGSIPISEKTNNKDVNGHYIYKTKPVEVDFIGNKGPERIYIQCCLNLSDKAVYQRESRSLIRIPDSFEKIILTRDGLKPRRDENGILIMDVINFLLDNKW